MIAENNDMDKQVDEDIFNCLNPESPKSFFLFAGAGSGKTRTLINVLTQFKETYGKDFKLRNRKIAIITYTNAAADEINHRLSFDSIFEVSTIHSFCWELIKNYTVDIKKWIEKDTQESILDLEDKLSRARNPNNKTAISNRKKLESKNKRLISLTSVNKFVYNPNGDNYNKASLNHAEVISIASYFLDSKVVFKEVLINKYPIVLIDESQDTKKDLIEALFGLQSEYKDSFSLGLFGDTMQRIYSDGKERLGEDLPDDWINPIKKMNHRSKSRIVILNNAIRKDIDGQEQYARSENEGGKIIFFIVPRSADKLIAEDSIRKIMSEKTGDLKWIEKNIAEDKKDLTVKVLTLEHHMSAVRMGFDSFFSPLYQVDKLKQGLLDGNLSFVNFFIKIILPIYKAHLTNNKFEISNIVKKHSPFFDKTNITKEKNKEVILTKSKSGIEKLLLLWNEGNSPSLIEILNNINDSNIFSIPSELKISIERSKSTGDDDEDDDDDMLLALDIALQSKFQEIINYEKYISDNSNFGTHQGVKGLEFDRVMVVIDDEEAKGFMFSYDKIFGMKELTKSDNQKIAEGKETGIDRTSRLFYVACSRAKESLAIVSYTDNPEKLELKIKSLGWFKDEEIKLI